MLQNGDKTIAISLQNKFEWQCDGETRTISSVDVCFASKTANEDPRKSKIIYNKSANTYTIVTKNSSLSDNDLAKIIANF